MKIDKIITLANRNTRLEFIAMERSLRATGSTLPVHVIPYDDNLFDLPDNSSWWKDEQITGWLAEYNAHPSMRKYQCMITANYQFVDTDICFISDPSAALAGHSGFITCCGHWHNIEHACNDQIVSIFSKQSTLWQKRLFNSGQFACDRILYTREKLTETCLMTDYIHTALKWPHNEQPGLNLLVWLSDVPYTNLTLPPVDMESSWAGDYTGEYIKYWQNSSKKPYLIHWAGLTPDYSRDVDKIFFDYLTDSEKQEYLHAGMKNSRNPLKFVKKLLNKSE